MPGIGGEDEFSVAKYHIWISVHAHSCTVIVRPLAGLTPAGAALSILHSPSGVSQACRDLETRRSRDRERFEPSDKGRRIPAAAGRRRTLAMRSNERRASWSRACGHTMLRWLSAQSSTKEGLNKCLLHFSDAQGESALSALLTFSVTYSHRKWWHIPVPREPLINQRFPKRSVSAFRYGTSVEVTASP